MEWLLDKVIIIVIHPTCNAKLDVGINCAEFPSKYLHTANSFPTASQYVVEGVLGFM